MSQTITTRCDLEAYQLVKLRQLLAILVPGNAFYTHKLNGAGVTADISSIRAFAEQMPFTLKQELVDDQAAHPPYGTNLTYPPSRYTKLHQTSGTTHQPLRWLDTLEDWNWMVDHWVQAYRAAGIDASDRIAFAFSFGPFLGFWTAFDAAEKIGCLTLPGGGLTSIARLHMMADNGATVLCCTPTYAMRLIEIAKDQAIAPSQMALKAIFVAGEPGGCLPAFRARMESAWPNAHVFDQHGMTEVGPVTYQTPERPDTLTVMERSYLAEVIDSESRDPVPRGQIGELVLTTLGRVGSPLLRYRTGDLVRAVEIDDTRVGYPCLGLEGGIIGRNDDMVCVRGMNIYPTAIDQIVRSCNGIGEYRVEVQSSRSMTELNILIEPDRDRSDVIDLGPRLENELRAALAIRIPVRVVARGSLPQFEMKAKRWIKMDE